MRPERQVVRHQRSNTQWSYSFLIVFLSVMWYSTESHLHWCYLCNKKSVYIPLFPQTFHPVSKTMMDVWNKSTWTLSQLAELNFCYFICNFYSSISCSYSRLSWTVQPSINTSIIQSQFCYCILIGLFSCFAFWYVYIFIFPLAMSAGFSCQFLILLCLTDFNFHFMKTVF